MSEPTNKKLYAKVKAEAKRKFDVWPSAYASSWLVKEYKRRGGKYKGSRSKKSRSRSKKSRSRSRKSRSRSRKSKGGLTQWHKEKWIDVCQLPKKVPCGRSKSNTRKYPYCRPSVRVNSTTPKTYKEFSKAELKSRCSRKRRSPSKRVT